MTHEGTVHRLAAAALMWCWSAQVSLADPLHKVGNESAWQHADSGWLFPMLIGDFARVAAPYTIDGNNDVGVHYRLVSNGSRASAIVEVYAADSAATDAKFTNAKAALELDAKSGAGAHPQSEGPFAVDEQRELVGVKVTYTVAEAGRASQMSLYFFDRGGWVVKIRTAAETTDAATANALDEFVRAQPWDRLGVQTGGLH